MLTCGGRMAHSHTNASRTNVSVSQECKQSRKQCKRSRRSYCWYLDELVWNLTGVRGWTYFIHLSMKFSTVCPIQDPGQCQSCLVSSISDKKNAFNTKEQEKQASGVRLHTHVLSSPFYELSRCKIGVIAHSKDDCFSQNIQPAKCQLSTKGSG